MVREYDSQILGSAGYRRLSTNLLSSRALVRTPPLLVANPNEIAASTRRNRGGPLGFARGDTYFRESRQPPLPATPLEMGLRHSYQGCREGFRGKKLAHDRIKRSRTLVPWLSPRHQTDRAGHHDCHRGDVMRPETTCALRARRGVSSPAHQSATEVRESLNQ